MWTSQLAQSNNIVKGNNGGAEQSALFLFPCDVVKVLLVHAQYIQKKYHFQLNAPFVMRIEVIAFTR
jgi:hypothetical protein